MEFRLSGVTPQMLRVKPWMVVLEVENAVAFVFLLPLGPARFLKRDVGVGVAGVALE